MKTNAKLKDYLFLNRIGVGNYSEVWKAVEVATKNVCAIKMLDNQQIQNQPKVLELLKSEIRILKSINSENVVRLYDSFFEQNHYYLVMEYCDGGDVERFVKSKPTRTISEAEALIFFKQMLNGFQALHKEKVMHRDFKLANVLIHDGILKIADLGFSKQAEVADTALGTAAYMAPEILQFEKYNNKIDIWSLGVCLYEMVMGKIPFKGYNEKDLLAKIMFNKIDFQVKGIETSLEFQDLIKNMLIPDPMKRINWMDLYNHKILNPKPGENDIHKPQTKKDLDIVAQEVLFNNNKSFYQDGSNLDYEDTLNILLKKLNKKKENPSEIKESDSYEMINSEEKKEKTEKEPEKPPKQQKKQDLMENEEQKQNEMKEKIELEVVEKNKSLLLLENKYLHMKNVISFHARVLNDGYNLIRNKNGIYIYFILSKRLLFLSKEFSEALEQKKNIFGDLNFDTFSKQWSFEKIASVFKEEKVIYEVYFDSLLADIQNYETKNNPLYVRLQGEFNKNCENVNDLLFKEILLDYCMSGQIWIEKYMKEKNEQVAKKFAKHLIELVDCFMFQEFFGFNPNEEAGYNFEKYMGGIEKEAFNDLIKLLNEKINNLLN